MSIPCSIDNVPIEYPASQWSLKNSTVVETAADQVDHPTDSAGRCIFTQSDFDVFKKRYGLTRDRRTFNILMIAADLQGCGYARIERPARYINRNPHWVAFPTVKITPELVHWSHVMVWQRQHKDDMLPVFELGRKLHKVQIFDIDDNLHAIPRHNPVYATYNRETKPYYNLLHWMRRCDLVTVSKQELGEFYKGLIGIRYAVLPNCIDFAEFPVIDRPRMTNDRVRIGWAGSTTHFEDLRIIAGVFAELKKSYGDRIELVMMGSDGIRRTRRKIDRHGSDDEDNYRVTEEEDVLKGIPREFHDAVPTETYGQTLCDLNLDIAVVPLAQSQFNLSGKSNIKYLEMSAAKIPCVLSRDTVYNEVSHGENGFLADKSKEWRHCLDLLIQDRTLRQRIAENAYRYVRDHYNFADKVHFWMRTYMEIMAFKNETLQKE